MRKLISGILILFSLTATAQNTGRLKSAVDNTLIDIVSNFYETSPEQSLKSLEELKKYTPDNDALYYYSGLCRYALNDVQGARKDLEKAASLDSANHWYLSTLADFCSENGFNDRAGELYARLLEKHPELYKNAPTLTRAADMDFSAGRDSSAKVLYRQALLLDPDYIPAVMGMSEIYRMENDIHAFMSSVRKMTSSDVVVPGFKVKYLRNLFEYVDAGFYSMWGAQLDSMVNDVVRLSPPDSSVLRFAGSWYYGTGRNSEGRRYFDEWLNLYPEDASALELQADLAYLDGDLPRMMELLEKIISLKDLPDSAKLSAYARIGDAYASAEDFASAFKYYDKVLKINPKFTSTLNNYAYFLSLMGKKLRKAARMSKITIEAEPDNATYLDTYGWILFLQGKNEEAKLQFKRAMMYGGKESKVILEHYVEVLKALGENDLADVYRILAENSKDED